MLVKGTQCYCNNKERFLVTMGGRNSIYTHTHTYIWTYVYTDAEYLLRKDKYLLLWMVIAYSDALLLCIILWHPQSCYCPTPNHGSRSFLSLMNYIVVVQVAIESHVGEWSLYARWIVKYVSRVYVCVTLFLKLYIIDNVHVVATCFVHTFNILPMIRKLWQSSWQGWLIHIGLKMMIYITRIGITEPEHDTKPASDHLLWTPITLYNGPFLSHAVILPSF